MNYEFIISDQVHAVARGIPVVYLKNTTNQYSARYVRHLSELTFKVDFLI